MRNTIYPILLSIIFMWGSAYGQEINWETFDPKTASPEEMQQVVDFLENNARQFRKTDGSPLDIKSLIMNGNKISTVVYNYGNITRPNTLCQVADLVWNRLGYGFEFTPLVAGEVIKGNGDTVRILDDGMWLPNQGGYAPDGSIKWGWLPKSGFADPSQPDIAAWSHRKDVQGDLTRKPHSWPESFYNPILGRYVWPAFLGNDATSPDEEVYFVADDYTNAKYEYYPFPNDSTKRGLGLDLECRFFQFNNPLAEDIIFLVYRVTNRSAYTINKVYFGMYGDPHVGGCSDFGDDRAFFIPPSGPLADPFPQRARSMVYAFDQDGVGQGGLPTGHFGFKFLESPSNSIDGIDNDDDGIIDESPFNDAGFFIDGSSVPLTTGIADTAKYRRLYGTPKPRWSGDENGNWSLEKNDVGIDGLPGTGDFGEGNGRPDIGFDANGNLVAEPNFGIRDVNESDQIGLTSFNVLQYTNSLPNVPKNDVLFWQLLASDSINADQTLLQNPGDNVFLYGSGPFTLGPGETQRFSIALLMGNDLQDLILNAETSQRVLEANYQFAQPPPKPNVTAVPGDGYVTLYWDNVSENAVDPLTGENDFEGYKIYRSEDYTFADVFSITDANGTPFLGKPYTQNGIKAQFDLVNQWSGLHPVEYAGRGVKYDVGNNTGLVHNYRDFNVVNGKTYYYAVASYDHGYDTLGVELPPTESQISIIQDPITKEFEFDANTVTVKPGPLPSGTSPAGVSNNFLATHDAGDATGSVFVLVLDDLSVLDGAKYDVDFVTPDSALVYNIIPQTPFAESALARDTLFVSLSRKNLIDGTITIRDDGGQIIDPGRYFVDVQQGRLRGSSPGSLPPGTKLNITYQYNAVFQSDRFSNEDDNAVFDGLRVFVENKSLAIDSSNSGFIGGGGTNLVSKHHKSLAFPTLPFRLAPIDVQIIWNDTAVDSAGNWLFPGDTLLDQTLQRKVVTPFRIVNISDTSKLRVVVNNTITQKIWKPGKELAFLTPTRFSPPPNALMYAITFYRPADTSLAVVYPPTGAIYEAKTSKPFTTSDRYSFTSIAAKFDVAAARDKLKDIYVVPNPFVAFSALETPGTTVNNRGDLNLQFRNLPPQCTIRIYTLVGELIDTIVKDDTNSFAEWNILSYEGQRLAYGVYIYHVDVPGVGEKIGRFALIK